MTAHTGRDDSLGRPPIAFGKNRPLPEATQTS
eukprot:CAMPEP_0119465328 /NCGR_PEP_ID=MMETSP1344-20130328/505_1 /TAXON_ID=236787 /ORGANISM="Florenciella parvula, Strain CCMP2471" /LENGTH=31 /DNA_ID= /DNA_START= /DNA_END= /DNA_ORIENTATION=